MLRLTDAEARSVVTESQFKGPKVAIDVTPGILSAMLYFQDFQEQN
jgi:hypothetical protein